MWWTHLRTIVSLAQMEKLCRSWPPWPDRSGGNYYLFVLFAVDGGTTLITFISQQCPSRVIAFHTKIQSNRFTNLYLTSFCPRLCPSEIRFFANPVETFPISLLLPMPSFIPTFKSLLNDLPIAVAIDYRTEFCFFLNISQLWVFLG